MTHKELVKRAALWLKNNQNCSVVICERATRCSETPDALGFLNGSSSILIEAKSSRSDFLADKNKYFRKMPEYGVGDERYFFVSDGVILDTDDVGEWGIVQCTGKQCRVKKKSGKFESHKRNEISMLTSMIRRLEISGAVFVRHEYKETESNDRD